MLAKGKSWAICPSLLDVEVVTMTGRLYLTRKGNGLSLSLFQSDIGMKKPRKLRCIFLRFSPTYPAINLQVKQVYEWQ